MNYIEIERAGYSSWPALEQHEKDGWIYRFAGGYTKRANSVNVLSRSREPELERILDAEQQYNSRRLPCIFRLLSFNDNRSLEQHLDQKNYKKVDDTLVMVQDISGKEFPCASMKLIPVDDWIDLFCVIAEKDPGPQQTHKEMIKSINQKTILAVLEKDNRQVACGLGVIANSCFGLFDLVTDKNLRRKGYARELLSGMLDWSIREGAELAYLQVVADNEPAVQLYEKMGYQFAYQYYYKVQEY